MLPHGAFNQFLQWEEASRDVVVVKLTYIDMAGGDINAGLLLSRIIYWNLPSRGGGIKLRVEKNGAFWLAKGRKDWYEEVRLREKAFDRASNILVSLGLIEKATFKFNGAPTVHVRIIQDTFMNSWLKAIFPDRENGNSLIGNMETADRGITINIDYNIDYYISTFPEIKAFQHPAVKAFWDSGGRFHKGVLASNGLPKASNAAKGIAEAVAERDIEYWAELVRRYTAQWLSTSYKMMLKRYASRNLPTDSQAKVHPEAESLFERCLKHIPVHPTGDPILAVDRELPALSAMLGNGYKANQIISTYRAMLDDSFFVEQNITVRMKHVEKRIAATNGRRRSIYS